MRFLRRYACVIQGTTPPPKPSFSSSLQLWHHPPSFLMYKCFYPSHLSPMGDKKALLLLVIPFSANNSIPLCMLALFSLGSVARWNPGTLTQYDFAQINSSGKNHTGAFAVQKLHTHHIHNWFNNSHPCWRLLLLAWGLPCFDVAWYWYGVKKEAEWPQEGIRKSAPRMHSIHVYAFVGRYTAKSFKDKKHCENTTYSLHRTDRQPIDL